MELKQKLNKDLESGLMSMEIDFFEETSEILQIRTIGNNVIREIMNIKNSVLD